MSVTFVPAVRLEVLPAELPLPGEVSGSADAITEHARTARGRYDDAAASWAQLSDGRFITPQAEEVHSAFERLVLPVVQDYESAAGLTTNALVAFQDAIDRLRPSIQDAREQAYVMNAVPPPERDDAFWAQAQNLQARLNGLGEQYAQAVEDCVNALNRAAAQQRSTSWQAGPASMLSMSSTISERAAKHLPEASLFKPYEKDGRLMSAFKGTGLTGAAAHSATWMARKAGVPDDYIDRVHEAASGGKRVSNNETSAMLRSAAKDPTALGFVLRKFPALQKSKTSVKGDQVSMRLQLTDPAGPPRRTGKSSTAMRNAVNKLEDLSQSKAAKFLGPAGLALGAYGNYNQGYNDSLRRNPNATEAEHRKEARLDSAMKTGANLAGSLAGASVGRAAGAALGQVLIPVPGVGMAIGAVAGSLLGGYFGSKLGDTFGDAANESRYEGARIEDQFLAGGKAVLDSVNPFSTTGP
ncbi:hypothetical protein [Zhihengliuella salsuginis]|uniref:Uncharacterized protein n=1 Tax=Zhihengliuella salsuginis TaxID=578222 RepID=A0ABQ3GK17_9MICC|nr:hypothetical protein [Zhihengliuella salsuginis]GHD06139.1 hypothetical protein GCM10008096_15750 [Zhihengliuella salsuginis]